MAAVALSACGPSSTGQAAPIMPPSTSAPSTSTSTTSTSETSTSTTDSTTPAPPAESASTTPPTTAPLPSAPATEPATATPATTATPPTAATATAALMAGGATGDPVRELQSRLRQLNWYDADVTGTYEIMTTAGVRGFQDKRTLPATGAVDQTTWDRLLAVTRQPTDDEMHNRLVPGPALLKSGSTGVPVRDLQARLKQIGWWSGDTTDAYGPATTTAVRAFQGKRSIPTTGEVDQRTTDLLTTMTRTPTSDELDNVRPAPATGTAAGLDQRCLTGRVLCISKASRTLTWVVDGQAQRAMAVRFGSENNPTREGEFSVDRKNREWTSTLYGSKMPYSMFFSGGEAVHYSSDFAARGYAGASHGCVNVRDLAGLAALFDEVNVGDKVVVY